MDSAAILLGHRVHIARLQEGLSMQQLGEAIGFTGHYAACYVNLVEHGKLEPKLKHLRPLARALGLTVDQLIP